MPIEFEVPSLRIQVQERLPEDELRITRAEQLLRLDKEKFHSERRLEREHLRHKAFVDRHGRRNVETLRVGTFALVFSTCSGLMSGKLKLRWSGPFWITNTRASAFQLGTLDDQVLPVWVNGFWCKPYNGAVPPNPFICSHPIEADPTIGPPFFDPPTTPIIVTSNTIG